MIGWVLKPCMNLAPTRTPIHNSSNPSQLHKNPMFRTSFFKKEDLRDIDLQISGKKGGLGAEVRGSEAALSFVPFPVPLLPPRKYELDLFSSDHRSWALSNFNQLATFSMEMWKMLASVMDEEIVDCKREVLLANSPTKQSLARTWAMYILSPRKYECEKKTIVMVKMDIITRL